MCLFRKKRKTKVPESKKDIDDFCIEWSYKPNYTPLFGLYHLQFRSPQKPRFLDYHSQMVACGLSAEEAVNRLKSNNLKTSNMKYEEIKVGDVFRYQGVEETVISKSDEHRVITTIDSGIKPSTWSEDELHPLEPIKEELPEEGLLVHNLGTIVYRTGERSGYGFVCGIQSKYLLSKGWDFSTVCGWKPATPKQEEKFIEMLKKECEKHGLDKNTKIEKHADGSLLRDPDWMGGTPRFNSIMGYNKHGQIFHKGKFAKPLKEETTLELVSKASLDLSKFGVEIEQKGNVLMITLINK